MRTPDILAHLSRTTEGQILVGFAAETEDIVANAQAKLKAKKLDLLVANDVTDPASGFAVSTNRVRIITPDGRVESLPLLPKWEVAQRILNRVSRIIERRRKRADQASPAMAKPPRPRAGGAFSPPGLRPDRGPGG